MRRSRALAAVSAVERRLKAQASAAHSDVLRVATLGRRNRAAFARNLVTFNAGPERSAFACAISESHRTALSVESARLAVHRRTAAAAARAAVEAIVPWAQIRCGLERRIARRAAEIAS